MFRWLQCHHQSTLRFYPEVESRLGPTCILAATTFTSLDGLGLAALAIRVALGAVRRTSDRLVSPALVARHPGLLSCLSIQALYAGIWGIEPGSCEQSPPLVFAFSRWMFRIRTLSV